jgi:hypothetical protein
VTKASSASLGDLRHARDVDQLLDRGVREVAQRRLGDVDRQIADALEIGVDLDRRQDDAQVDRHRLVQRQQLDAAAVDLDVQLVDRRVAGEHLVDERPIAVDEAGDRRAHALLGEAAHLEQPRLELAQLLLEVRNRVRHPNRPVT